MRPGSLAAASFAAVLLACSSAPDSPGTPAVAQSSSLLRAARPVPGQFIVVFKDGAVHPADVDLHADDLARRHNGQILTTWRSAVRGFATRMSDAQAQALAHDPRVAFVEEDGEVHLDVTQTGATWGLDRIDQRNRPLDGSYTYNVDGSGVNAYIIDTGIRTTHVDFGGRASGAFTAVNDGNGTNDCNGHGTHVSGTVGGATWGVAKNVRLFAVRVLDCTGSGTTSGVISGVDWVTSNHLSPAVANMSLGGGASAALDTAVSNSIASGVTYAIAAGNSNVDACTQSPARVGPAITVAASDINDVRATFSNFGTCVDIFGPGVNITSAWATSDTATNTISGTSMATPHVTGAAALFLSANRTAAPAQVASALTANATANVIASPGTGSPNRLLFELFIGAAAGDTTPPTATLTAPAAGATVGGTAVTLSANASDNAAVSKVDFFVDGSLVGTDTTAPYAIAWNSGTVANGTHTFTARATDTSGNTGTSAAVTATVSNAAGTCATTSQLLGNPGFETGTATPWTATAGVINNQASPAPHGGAWKAWLDGYGVAHTDTLSQTVTIPAGACTASLSFWLWITTAETTTTTAFDTLTVTVTPSGGTATTLATFSNLNRSTTYVQRTFDLAAFKGRTITLQLRGVEDSSLQTSFLVDDTALTVTQ